MQRTIINLSKRITIPRLSPTHTKARVVRFIVPNGTKTSPYDPILILECSPDLIADPADRKSDDHRPMMLLETQEEGILQDLNDHNGEWLEVGTVLGSILEDDDDDLDINENDSEDDWTWQAYLHEDDHNGGCS
eukprot:CAMPEP_0204640054 /NCGR_PEP_ID=MMETSP0717-20131115/45385_1 /ASSEMBLY_ACC=CAM_ASM_000666 /TAXON_ID=230516 /ORGANISM="Chaetoceros curvisetus" /LENGTH=133 /DNA_ID=CAMNT_0051660349 /DNA_START=297 /DNA_END=698 /DNA_ORIENTATION=+